jgi:hypothetical protein
MAPYLPIGTTMSDEEYEDWYATHAWSPSRDPDLTLESDLDPAEWLEPLLVPESFEVWMTAPKGYEAYARIFFPFVRTGLDVAGERYEERVRWTDLAMENGRTVHALMERETITWSPAGENTGHRCSRRMSREQVEALTPILATHSISTEGRFLLWEGFGDLNDSVFNPKVPKVNHPMRSYYLLRGPFDSYSQFSQDPSYWWPDDRAWCLCTDTDFEWSYLAGSRECIDEVLAVPLMDAVETKPENPARSGMDLVNDPGGTVPRSP